MMCLAEENQTNIVCAQRNVSASPYAAASVQLQLKRTAPTQCDDDADDDDADDDDADDDADDDDDADGDDDDDADADADADDDDDADGDGDDDDVTTIYHKRSVAHGSTAGQPQRQKRNDAVCGQTERANECSHTEDGTQLPKWEGRDTLQP